MLHLFRFFFTPIVKSVFIALTWHIWWPWCTFFCSLKFIQICIVLLLMTYSKFYISWFKKWRIKIRISETKKSVDCFLWWLLSQNWLGLKYVLTGLSLVQMPSSKYFFRPFDIWFEISIFTSENAIALECKFNRGFLSLKKNLGFSSISWVYPLIWIDNSALSMSTVSY